MITTFTFLTFEEWKERNPDLGGERERPCKCKGKLNCKKCHGTGKLHAITLKEKYEQQRKLDEANLEKWLGKPSLEQSA